MEENNLRKTRIEKLNKIRQIVVNPYPNHVVRTHTIEDALQREGEIVAVTGRMMSYREHGNIAFADLRDGSGQIQVFFQKKLLPEDTFKNLKLLDIGDFIQVEGTVMKTIAGEISVTPTSYRLISKTLLPFPSEWYGFKDVEERYRKRYLDLLINDDSRERFLLRSTIINSIREYLNNDGALEVETPSLQPMYGGANARPFVTHHNALDKDFYLKIADELYLKRVVIGGIDKVYEIDHDFRNEGVDRSHNPEFTMLEVYYAYTNYEDMMVLTENIWQHAALTALGTTKITLGDKTIEIKAPWRRLTMKNAIKEYLHYDVDTMTDDEMVTVIQKYEPDFKKKDIVLRGLLIAKLFEFAEEYLIDPTFIIDFPKETTALCKPKEDDPDIIERFEPYINGWEVGNAYTELNDPLLQRKYFEDQLKYHIRHKEEAQPWDESFLTAMEHGMPPMGGMAIGLDRLVMILTNASNIKDVILFPTLKPELETQEESKKLEKIVIESGKKMFSKKTPKKQDFSRKMVVVINKSLPTWQAINTVAHESAYLGRKMESDFDTGDVFLSQDNLEFPRNTQYPIIALSAEPQSLAKLHDKVRESGLLYHIFIREMIETTNDKEIESMLSQKKVEEIEILGIGIFGPNEEVDKLTKGYSLWK